MNEQKHIINRQVLELTVSDRDHALSIQNNTASLVKNNLIPALDKLFSRLTTRDEVLRIDKLVLDIGDISSASLNEEMVTKTLEELEIKLKDLVLLKRSQKPGSATKSDDTEIVASFVSKPESQLEQLIHYLKFGVLPWWHDGKEKLSLNRLIQNVVKEKVETTSETIFPLIAFEQVKRRIAFQLNEQQFLELLRLFPIPRSAGEVFNILSPRKMKMDWENEAMFRYRFLKFISERSQLKDEELIEKLIGHLTHDMLINKTAVGQKQLANLIPYLIKTSLGKEFRKKIISLIIQSAKEQKADLSTLHVPGIEEFIDQEELDKYKVVTETDLEFAAESGEQADPVSESISSWPEKKSNVTDEQIEDGFTAKGELKEKAKEESKVEEEKALLEKASKRKEENKNLEQKKFRLDPEQMEIYVNNAGLVLLHPFLFYFFDGLGLLDKDKTFKNEQATYKAVHLLQYVVTGETASPEHELSLNKVLTGIDINDPIPFDVSLTKAEIEECENLQSVVLERWEALKTSNIEALTEGFLKREGRLSYKGIGWNLYVERKTLDIMLDKLPWSLSIIKLPWRNDLIYVEW